MAIVLDFEAARKARIQQQPVKAKRVKRTAAGSNRLSLQASIRRDAVRNRAKEAL